MTDAPSESVPDGETAGAGETLPRLARARLWWHVAKRVWHQIDERHMFLIAAGVAFYGMLAIFPAIAAVVALWGLFNDPANVLPQLEYYSGIIPDDAYSLLATQVQTLTSAESGALGWASGLSFAVALWSTRAGVAALMMGMNAVYVERNRQGLAHYATALVLTVSLIFVALVAIASIIIAPIIMAFVPLGPVAGFAAEAVRWVVAIAVLLFGAGIIYRYGPNRRGARVGWITPGALLAVALWGVASWGFGIYLSEFGRYSEVYGSIGAVVALLMWLFISAFLLLLGAAVNAELERHTRADSTVGPAKPLGERGAQAADTYIEV
ncbi:YihY/virulence factor BrkB family protein [Jannaschia seohaensis]|uniref:Membrane protein n=1 Tax=Jannaschia seohaensis TaxID=475081 RepID=A0A2Y9A4H1_9RHOB|nr:YihY/virulence factor BrkB family protein [Jannaschia seohaensis]PWJ22060.1 membrane protein [Jannaschia seohaensis]SSA38338.1 membrane protein [Jannaschia seohaensis]